jgi:hypothetical protein
MKLKTPIKQINLFIQNYFPARNTKTTSEQPLFSLNITSPNQNKPSGINLAKRESYLVLKKEREKRFLEIL